MSLKRRLSLKAAALIVASFISGCGPGNPLPNEEEVPPTAISQEIGPEGGELVAPEASVLAGVRLKVPAGALSSKVKITVDGTLDPTPLSSAAEQVGPQIAIGPAGTTFATPVELTVPLDQHAVTQHEQSSADCKVWYRTDGNWQRLERKAGSDGTVTVDLPGAGVAAAGVLAGSTSLSCAITPSRCTFPKLGATTSCTDPSGFCLQKLPQPQYAPIGQYPEFSVVQRKLYYAHAPAAGRISIARYDLVTGENVLLGTLDVPGLSVPANSPIAVESDGSAWIGLKQFGNAKFKQGAIPLRFDFGLENGREKRGEGAVVVGSTVVRLIKVLGGDLFITDGVTRRVFPAPAHHSDFSLLPSAVSGKFVAWNPNVVFRLGFNDAQATEALDINGGPFQVTSSPRSAGIAGAVNGNEVPDTVEWQTSSNVRQSFQQANRLAALDGDDHLYAASTTAPEIRLFTEQGGFGVIPLTTAMSPSPEYFKMQPRALLGVPGRKEVVVVVRGADTVVPQGVREFWLLSRAN